MLNNSERLNALAIALIRANTLQTKLPYEVIAKRPAPANVKDFFQVTEGFFGEPTIYVPEV